MITEKLSWYTEEFSLIRHWWSC